MGSRRRAGTSGTNLHDRSPRQATQTDEISGRRLAGPRCKERRFLGNKEARYSIADGTLSQQSETRAKDDAEDAAETDSATDTRIENITELPILPLARIACFLSLEERKRLRITCRRFLDADRLAWCQMSRLRLRHDLLRLVAPGRLNDLHFASGSLLRPHLRRLLPWLRPACMRRIDFGGGRFKTLLSTSFFNQVFRPAVGWHNRVLELNLNRCIFGVPELELLARVFPAVDTLRFNSADMLLQDAPGQQRIQQILDICRAHFSRLEFLHISGL